MAQDGECLWPKRDLVTAEQQASAVEIKDMATELQSPRPRWRLRVDVAGGHRCPIVRGVCYD
jgi:hypothetical protein